MREARMKTGLTRTDTAQRIGCFESTVQRAEAGTVGPRPPTSTPTGVGTTPSSRPSTARRPRRLLADRSGEQLQEHRGNESGAERRWGRLLAHLYTCGSCRARAVSMSGTAGSSRGSGWGRSPFALTGLAGGPVNSVGTGQRSE
ncbi:helix-turn-helix transcriptional regulator [Streptomyces sp. NPDC001787]|uniref:helix-turn-helix transcriptional regulator n=1 Tax=Streptomyces sp. NPDC001787 TaxID=3154523 RepID=UPI00332BF839